MGQQISKDELVYQRVIEGNVEAIKALCSEGARLEWIDKEGKTPLIVACMDHRLYIVAKTLIELDANVNAYRPGRHAGTALHHAAKRGLDHTVKLLLSQGAKPFVRNDGCQTPLDLARAKGYHSVVRAIEAHICYFSGEIREILVVPSILERLVSQRISRKWSKKSWVVVVPCKSPHPRRPPKLELVVYSSPQDPQPHTVIALWNCSIAEPKFPESDPTLTIFNKSSGKSYKFLSAIEGDGQQLTQLYSACRGLRTVMPSPQLSNTGASPSSMAINASIQSATNNRAEFSSDEAKSGPSSSETATNDLVSNATDNEWGQSSGPPPSKESFNGGADQPATEEYNGCAEPESSPAMAEPTIDVPTPISSAPSAPPMPGDLLDNGPIHYPAIDESPVPLTVTTSEPKGKTDSSCVICWEAPIEGACIPCGHMAGCMSCLTEIKSKKGVCPVCRAKIDQVTKLYAV